MFEDLKENWNLKLLMSSIIDDSKSWVKFKYNNWHLHGITMPIMMLIVWFTGYSYKNGMTSGLLGILGSLRDGVPFWFELFVLTFGLFSVCWLVEFIQGIIYNSNRTPAERFESNKDILVGVIFGWIGMLMGYIVF